MIRVSVVIPAHNRGWSLPRAIESVLRQSMSQYELIVVDDGSTDQTAAALAPYANRLQYITQENAGVSAARNAGIRAAKGEFVAFLDSDDEWLPGKLAAQCAFFNANPPYVICQTLERWIRHGRFTNIPETHKKKADFIFGESLRRCMITCSSVMIRRALFDEVGLFNETLPACEDYDLWLRIARRHPIGLIPTEHLIRYGGHADQLSSRYTGNDRYRIRSIMGLLASGDLTSEQRQHAMAELKWKCQVYGEGCKKRARAEEAERFLSIPEAFHEI